MKPLFAAIAGFALVGAVGATQRSAQRVRIDINKGDKHVSVNTGSRGAASRDSDFRKPSRVENKQSGHFAIVKKKVFVPGHFEDREVRVFVPGKYVTVRERRIDSCGHVFYVNVCRFVAAHYETVCKKVFVPGCYEIREERVWVADDCGCDTGHGGGHDKGNDHGNGHQTSPGHSGNGNGKKGGRSSRSRQGHGRR